MSSTTINTVDENPERRPTLRDTINVVGEVPTTMSMLTLGVLLELTGISPAADGNGGHRFSLADIMHSRQEGPGRNEFIGGNWVGEGTDLFHIN